MRIQAILLILAFLMPLAVSSSLFSDGINEYCEVGQVDFDEEDGKESREKLGEDDSKEYADYFRSDYRLQAEGIKIGSRWHPILKYLCGAIHTPPPEHYT